MLKAFGCQATDCISDVLLQRIAKRVVVQIFDSLSIFATGCAAGRQVVATLITSASEICELQKIFSTNVSCKSRVIR